MKTAHLIAGLTVCAVLASAHAKAATPANPVSPVQGADPRLRTVAFSPDAVVDVPVRRGQITQIVLGDDELVVGTPMSGKGANCADETHTWCIAQQGRDLFVKPKTGASSNNLIVITDRRRHVFALHPVEGGNVALMRLTVSAPAPVPTLPRLAAAPTYTIPVPTAKELIEARWQVKPAVRNADYSVATGKDSEDIVPVMVFDDGTQTYFSFPNNRPLPAIFQTAPDGSEEMVNARMDADDLLVADRVGRRFLLRLGESVVSIINEAFDLDGVAPTRGTTVPGVSRVLKAAATASTAGTVQARQTP